eukprot:scaffold3352_cov130-Isochrysis_galbana.AAC.1
MAVALAGERPCSPPSRPRARGTRLAPSTASRPEVSSATGPSHFRSLAKGPDEARHGARPEQQPGGGSVESCPDWHLPEQEGGGGGQQRVWRDGGHVGLQVALCGQDG